METFDAIVVSGASINPDGTLSVKAAERVNAGVDAFEAQVAPNMIFSGNHSFLLDTPPVTSEAKAMQQYAIAQSIPEDVTYLEEESLDTIGNALFTKINVAIPHNFGDLGLVTSAAHMSRAIEIYHRVMGPDFKIGGIAVHEEARAIDKVYELVAAAITREILFGIKPGDHEAIYRRLVELVPGYGMSTKANLARRSLAGLVGIH